MRTILHSDCNNFYASVECALNPELRGKPVAVCGDPEMRHGIVLAKNYLAKIKGVSTGEAVWQAKQKCPGLVVVTPDGRKYLRYSRLVRDIYRRYTDRIEPYGLDESWLDVTGCALSGAEVAAQLRAAAREELGITLSVGVSFNKVFAKLASDIRKPDATTVVSYENYKRKIWPLPAGALLFVGNSTQEKLAAHGIYTIGDLARADGEMLARLFGKAGEMLRVNALGLNDEPVMRYGEEDALKSVGNSTTPPHDVRNYEEAKMVIGLLADSVATRMRAHGVRCGTVALWMRDTALSSCERQAPVPSTNLSLDIGECALRLLRENYAWSLPLRSLGVRGTDLRPASAATQESLFSDPRREKAARIEPVLDSLRGRFGFASVQKALMLGDRALSGVHPSEEQETQPLAHQRGRG